MLEVRDVSAGYGSFEVLHGVSLAVPEHQVVALLGHNGAGKSTLLKTIYGQLPVRGGAVLFRGQARVGGGGAASARQGMRYVPQEGNTFADLSIADNLKLGAYAVAPDRTRLAEAMEQVFGLFPILRERRAAPASVLSGGERQMLAISLALMTTPQLLLLDEPSAGLAPIMAQRVFDAVRQLCADLGTTVLLVEQNVRLGLSMATHGVVLEGGRVALDAPAADLVANPEVAELYLGGAPGEHHTGPARQEAARPADAGSPR
jgi:branched-chain amino acid transport system ATP-binding protein